jgi:hypothetical protein
MVKKCGGPCGLVKFVSDFNKSATNNDGLSSDCKECSRKRALEWYYADLERTKEKSEIRKYTKHGLSLEEYLELLNKYDRTCYSCGRSWEEAGFLCVDHDHRCCPSYQRSCGKCTRGLLCSQCNLALGLLGESPDRVRKLLTYIEATYVAELVPSKSSIVNQTKRVAKHGTHSMYGHGCKCEACTEAHRLYTIEYRQKIRNKNQV